VKVGVTIKAKVRRVWGQASENEKKPESGALIGPRMRPKGLIGWMWSLFDYIVIFLVKKELKDSRGCESRECWLLQL